MIELVWIDGKAIPKVFCDSCGEEITQAKEAAIVYENFMPNGQRTNIVHVHKNFVKGSCMTIAEDGVRQNGRDPGWAELGSFLANLVHNAGMKLEDVDRHLS